MYSADFCTAMLLLNINEMHGVAEIFFFFGQTELIMERILY